MKKSVADQQQQQLTSSSSSSSITASSPSPSSSSILDKSKLQPSIDNSHYSANKLNKNNNNNGDNNASSPDNFKDDNYEERFNALLNEFANEGDDDSSLFKCFGCTSPDRICGLKVDTIIRFLKVITAYPFVIVVSSLNLSNKYAFLR